MDGKNHMLFWVYKEDISSPPYIGEKLKWTVAGINISK